MEAFQNNPEFKRQLVEAAIEHRKAGDYLPGEYAKKNGRFRGCSVGCSLHDVQKLRGVAVEDYGDHGLLADTLGVPEWLCRLQDGIFENLPDDQRSGWTERLYAAIPIGADLEPVHHKLVIRRVARLADAQRKAFESTTDEHGQVLAVLNQVLACHRDESGKLADAIKQVIAALNIDCAADWSAVPSAARSAESAAWKQEADDLIEILSGLE